MKFLSLFSGIGGLDLGLERAGWECMGQVEIDPFASAVLAKHWPDVRRWSDVREITASDVVGSVGRPDAIVGGFPCQPWSVAGKQRGADDPRHLWPEMARIVEEVRPTYVFAENVQLAAFEEPWRDLRRLGYRVPPALCVAAADVGAPHLRKRWWLLAADADSAGATRLSSGAEAEVARVGNGSQKATDADSAGLERHGENSLRTGETHATPSSSCWWQTEPPVGRVVDGLAHRVDRLRALGNGQVPMAAATAWQHLIQQI